MNGKLYFSGRQRSFKLDTHPGLFLDFSACNREAEILSFAIKYGSLWRHSNEESIESWSVAIANLRSILIIIDAFDKTCDLNEFTHLFEKTDDIRSAANKYISQQISKQLCSVGMRIERSHLVPDPSNLLAVMWLQMTDYWWGQTELKRCEVCNKWFDKKKAWQKSTCSEKCRRAKHRLLRKNVLQLAEQGKTAKEIAKQIGKDVKMIKRWIESAK